MSRYECHIKVDPSHRLIIEPIAKKARFKVSEIAGDEASGDTKFLYCTTSDSDYQRIFNRMNGLVDKLGVPILRRKIEEIIFDERS